MSLRTVLHSALLAGVVGLMMPPIARADEVGAYLRRHGLQQLLARHLEEQLERASNEDRPEIAMQLAEIYAELLESTSDQALQEDLKARSRDLLSIVPEESADELRLALLRGSYTAAERTAESHRLRMSDDASIERAKGTLTEVLPSFKLLRERLDEQIEVTDRRRSRATGVQASRLHDQLQRLESVRARAAFMNAWALYYRAFLNDSPEFARMAEELFGRILDPGVTNVAVQDVSIDLLATESYARTLLGMALSKSLTSGPIEAFRWLVLLEGDDVHPTVRDQLPAWRLAILLEHREFRDAKRLLEQQADQRREVPVAWIRLAAAYALEATARDAHAHELAKYTIADLAQRGELQQVLDLAERFGTDAVGGTGFAGHYVRGAQLYQQARRDHGTESPTADPELAQLYGDAAREFAAAVVQPDADEFGGAAAGAQKLIGWCLYFQGRFYEARDAFVAAAELLPSHEAPQALWMAIVSIDQVARASADPSVNSELAQLINDFLVTYPSSEYVPQLLLRQAEAEPTLERVEKLLTIPPDHEAFAASQRTAAQMLYRMFEAASDRSQVDLGERYLALAFPRWMAADPGDWTNDPEARTAFLVRGRRILNVALTPGIDRPRAATETLARFDALETTGVVDLSPFREELTYRRFQAALIDNDLEAAGEYVDLLWERERSSAWSMTAVRLMFQTIARAWREMGSDPGDRDALERIVLYGGRTLHEFEQDDRSLDDGSVFASYATVAEAAMLLWQQTGGEAEGRQALYLSQKLLTERPTNQRFLRAVGLLASEFGQPEEALEAWRKLSVGADERSDLWYEARYNLIRLHIATDPAYAKQVYDQMRALYPDLGPEPWASRFRALEAEIAAAIGATGNDTGDADG